MVKAAISIRMATYSCHESALVHVGMEGSRSGHKLKFLLQPTSRLGSWFDSWGQGDDCCLIAGVEESSFNNIQHY